MDIDTQASSPTTQDQANIGPSFSPTQQPQETKKSKIILLVVLFLIITTVAGAGGYLYGKTRGTANHTDTIGTIPNDWQPLLSSKKGFPIESGDNEILTYYSLDERKVVSLDSIQLSKNRGSSAGGKGSSSPVASPSLHHIAFIGKDDNLWLFSVETQQTKQLTTNGLVSFITGWSPDSKSILYHYERKTIANSSWGIDAPLIETISFKPQIEQGFYQTNIETGKVTPLTPIESTEGYINNNTLLVKIEPESNMLAAFTIDTLEADLRSIEIEADFGVGQFAFSSDGKKWAFSNPLDKARPTEGQKQLVLGDYPAATTVIDSGSWAEVQFPMFSSDDTKIAYQKTTGVINGISQNQVWIYDITSGVKRNSGGGSPVRWIDEKTILVRTSLDLTGQKFSLLNIETGENTSI